MNPDLDENITWIVYQCTACTFLNEEPKSKCGICHSDAPAHAKIVKVSEQQQAALAKEKKLEEEKQKNLERERRQKEKEEIAALFKKEKHL